MYRYNRNWDEYFVLYREVFFIQSVLYQRLHCKLKVLNTQHT